MRVGIIGLGKLGLPVAYAMASRGLDVYGYDPHVIGPPADISHEQALDAAIKLGRKRMHFCASAHEVVQKTDGVVFVAVQTPHEPRFEGVTPLPDDRADFDYTYLVQAAKEVSAASDRQHKPITMAVISTVLPGTMQRYVRPVLGRNVSLVYNPSFIAMGTTVKDFLDPEFVLLGADGFAYERVSELYDCLGIGPQRLTNVANAELIKVAYNTFIGLKIAFANTLMEVCHKTPGTNVDEVTGALKLAHRRLISPAYMDGGMGDGGGCHPRDNIALSWLAGELDLSYDLFGAAMECREAQAEWLADLMLKEQSDPINRYPSGGHRLKPGLGILGVAYKPGSAITTGSPARLVRELLRQRGAQAIEYDPYVYTEAAKEEWVDRSSARIWLVGCKHPECPNVRFPKGSVVIDPFRYMPDQEGVRVIRVGG